MEYDVIIIGAGSVGVPTALALSRGELKTLVLDSFPSVSQGDNKHAIGGIRATHSHKAKIKLCQRSIEIFSSWEDKYGDDVWWSQGGYCFVAYTQEDENLLKDTVRIQKNYGLNINYLYTDKIQELVPGINPNGLLGGTFSPEDGNASPLLALHAFYRKSKEYGTQYKFNESVSDIIINNNNRVIGVKTDKGTYKSRYVVNAAGANAKSIAKMVDVDVEVQPESHEAGITEPVKEFFNPMVVDLRAFKDPVFGHSKNYYFYQNKEGKILFCLTPNPNIPGKDRRETSSFLPQISKRLIDILPRLKFIKVRRTWRGLYPMTPDGNPIIGEIDTLDGYVNAVGLCGQGFMLGPGLGELLYRLIDKKLTIQDHEILTSLSYNRDFCREEDLK
jgi:sarcosine oxidase subunit beta